MNTDQLIQEDLQSDISTAGSFESIELTVNAPDHDEIVEFAKQFIDAPIRYTLNAQAFQYYAHKLEDSPGPSTYYYLARCYMLGFGIPANLELAYQHMVSAANLLHPSALHDLNQLFRSPSYPNRRPPYMAYLVNDYNFRRLKVASLLMSAALGNYNTAIKQLLDLSQQDSVWQDMINHLDMIYTNLIHRYFQGDDRHLMDLQRIAMRNAQLLQANADGSDKIDRIYSETVLITENELFQDAKNFSQDTIADICNQLGILRYMQSLQPTQIHHKGELITHALTYFKHAAALNCTAAYYNMANYYDQLVYYGNVVTTSKWQIMTEAAARGHPLAQYELGYQCLHSPSKTDQLQGWMYLMLSSKLGYSDNLYLVAMSYLREDYRLFDCGNADLARTMLKLAIFSLEIPAAKYSKRECFLLGFAYQHQLWLDDTSDTLLHVNRYRLAAHFYAYAITKQLNCYLPHCYLAKLIEKRDDRSSSISYVIALYHLATNDQDVAVKGYACYRLGKTYANRSSHTYYNPSKANDSFTKAAYYLEMAANSINGQYYYANILLHGLGVIRDKPKALDILYTICNHMRHYGDPYQSYIQSKARRRLNDLSQA